jgi:putative SOS response-associated peptidase YedK
MCGRYTLACPDEETLIRGLPFDAFSETRIQFRPRYNIAPGQRSPVVYLQSGRPVLADALWGMTRSGGGLAINARSETAERTALFRDAFGDGRCLVPADGFLEWRKEGRVNQPYLFRRTDGTLFVMAGLWHDGHYVILTRDSRGEVAEIHDRMPVLLDGDDVHQWLTKGKLGEPPDLTRTAVSPRINRTENDDPSCLAPLPQTTFKFD